MGTAGIKIKVMPSSPEANLEQIKKEIQKVIENKQGKNYKFDEELIAFGLKAIIVYFEWPEEQETENIENELKQIENVNSVQVIDMRRLL